MTRQSVRTLVHVYVKPDQADTFASLMRGLRDPTRAEPGCIRYDLQQSTDDPTHFVCVEEWESEAAFRQHVATHQALDIGEKLRGTLAKPLDVRRYRAMWD